jgi:hypothetical protein
MYKHAFTQLKMSIKECITLAKSGKCGKPTITQGILSPTNVSKPFQPVQPKLGAIAEICPDKFDLSTITRHLVTDFAHHSCQLKRKAATHAEAYESGTK